MNLEFLLAWAHARLDAARVIPPDALILITVTCVILLLVSYVGWVKASNRLHVLARAKTALEGEIATARRALDTERRWRVVAEKTAAEATKPALSPEPLPPHALQALLEREMASTTQLGAADAEPAEDTAAIDELEEPAPPPAERERQPAYSFAAEATPEPAVPAQAPAPAAPAAEQKPAPADKKPAAKTKASRRTAKVAGLINRTIFE
jgi:hypothetical protein